MRVNTNRWNRIRYTLWAPLYDKVVRFHRQRRRSVGLLELQFGELNLVANVIATDVIRQLGTLLRHTSLRIERRESAGFGGFFEIALLHKPV